VPLTVTGRGINLFKIKIAVPVIAPVTVFWDKDRLMGPKLLILMRLYQIPLQLVITGATAVELEVGNPLRVLGRKKVSAEMAAVGTGNIGVGAGSTGVRATGDKTGTGSMGAGATGGTSGASPSRAGAIGGTIGTGAMGVGGTGGTTKVGTAGKGATTVGITGGRITMGAPGAPIPAIAAAVRREVIVGGTTVGTAGPPGGKENKWSAVK
jgi:hypothetical protein